MRFRSLRIGHLFNVFSVFPQQAGRLVNVFWVGTVVNRLVAKTIGSVGLLQHTFPYSYINIC